MQSYAEWCSHKLRSTSASQNQNSETVSNIIIIIIKELFIHFVSKIAKKTGILSLPIMCVALANIALNLLYPVSG
jgi:hypothetical protein